MPSGADIARAPRVTVPSFAFLGFVAACAIVFHLARRDWRTTLNLVFNLAFLAGFSHTPGAFLPFAGFLAFGYVSLRLLQSGRRPLFWPLLAIALVAFFWLKKYTFIPSALFIDHPYVTVGLSYVFFRVLHLIIDAGSGDLATRIGVVDYLAYALDFTALVAGPIQLYPDYLESRTPLGVSSAGRALERLTIGFFKVFIVAAVLNGWHKHAIAGLGDADPTRRATALAGVVGWYPLYLYANFSGYTDAVIGAALLLSRRLPENFDRPFSSKSFIEFWSRWHMSLSNWLKTYVYNPLILTLMRRSSSRAVEPYLAAIAFFATFFLVGAWHGQTSEFLFFGLLQGGGVSDNKVYQIFLKKRLGRAGYRKLTVNPIYAAVCRGVTFVWFGFTLLWFWSRWRDIAGFTHALGIPMLLATLAALVIVATLVLALFEAMHEAIVARPAVAATLQSRYLRTSLVTAMIAVVLVSNFLLDAPAPEIVYKAF